MPRRGENYTMSNGKTFVLTETCLYPYSATWDSAAVGYVCPRCITRDEEHTCFGETKIHWHDCPKHKHLYDTECHLGVTWRERIDELRDAIVGYRFHEGDCTPETRHLWPTIRETYVHGDGCSFSAKPATKTAQAQDVYDKGQEIYTVLEELKALHAGKHFVPDSLAFEIDRLTRERDASWRARATYVKRCDGRYVNELGDMFTIEMNDAALAMLGVESDDDFKFNNFFMNNTDGTGEPGYRRHRQENEHIDESAAGPSGLSGQVVHLEFADTNTIRDHQGKLVEVDAASIWESRCNELSRFQVAHNESYHARQNAISCPPTSIKAEGKRIQSTTEQVKTSADAGTQTEDREDEAYDIPLKNECDESMVMVTKRRKCDQWDDAISDRSINDNLVTDEEDIARTTAVSAHLRIMADNNEQEDMATSDGSVTNDNLVDEEHVTENMAVDVDLTSTVVDNGHEHRQQSRITSLAGTSEHIEYAGNYNATDDGNSSVHNSNKSFCSDNDDHNDDIGTNNPTTPDTPLDSTENHCPHEVTIQHHKSEITSLESHIAILTSKYRFLGKQPIFSRSPFMWNTWPHPSFNKYPQGQPRPSRVMPKTLTSQAPLIAAGLYGHDTETLARQCWTENHEWWEWMQTWKRAEFKRELASLKDQVMEHRACIECEIEYETRCWCECCMKLVEREAASSGYGR